MVNFDYYLMHWDEVVARATNARVAERAALDATNDRTQDYYQRTIEIIHVPSGPTPVMHTGKREGKAYLELIPGEANWRKSVRARRAKLARLRKA